MFHLHPRWIPIFVCTTVMLCSEADVKANEVKLRSVHNGVEVNVESHGCTDKRMFSVKVDHKSQTLLLYRNMIDECKGWFPEGVWLKFQTEELEGVDVKRAFLSP
jgi:hypothetical protein